MNKLIFTSILLALTGCAPNPLPTYTMQPNKALYGQIEKDFYLKNKLAISNFESNLGDENSKIFYSNAHLAAQQALTQANLLSMDATKAQYILAANIMDVQYPSCMFGTCETGSSIEYSLTDSKTGSVVYKELLVVPHNYEYPVFGADPNVFIIEATGGAIGNNFAHLIHVLTNKNKADLK